MKRYLERLPQEIKGLIKTARQAASSNKARAYLVGGFVRDLILGVRNLDLDIVVEGDGILFAEKLAARLDARLTAHRRFGTATLTVKPHIKIDVASARSESYPAPAELPVVSAGTLRQDLFRRDFSINAMALNIFPGNFGGLVDCFGGAHDLRRKKVRVMHERSFIDDPTRILRAIRFEQRYGFRIEALTLRLLREASAAGMLAMVEPQRTRDELVLALKERHPLKNIRRIHGLTGLDFIRPRLRLSKKDYSFLRSIEREIRWFERTYPRRRPLDGWLMYFTGLLGPLNASQSEAVCGKFALRRGETKRVLSFKAANKSLISALSRAGVKPARIFSLLEPLSYETILLLKAKYGNPRLRKHVEDFFEVYNGMRICISGSELGAMGLAPGPVYKNIFTRVLEAKLNGRVKTRQQELALIRSLLRRRPEYLKGHA